MDASTFRREFEGALDYARYLQTGTPEQQTRWNTFYGQCPLSEGQSQRLSGFNRTMHVLVISGIWCGDCVQQCPLLARIAEAAPGAIQLRFVDRDQRKELSQQFRINGGDRVPVALFLAEDFELCSTFGDRSLNRYRAIARKQLGASCPTGIGGIDGEEVSATMNDWLDEFERVQLMLRLSPRLRKIHSD